MVLGLAIFMVCLGYAVSEFGASERRLASVEERVIGVDQQLRQAAQRRRAAQLSGDEARVEAVRLTSARDSLRAALRQLADERAHEESHAYLLLGGCVLGLLLFFTGYHPTHTELAGVRAAEAAVLHASRARPAVRARRSSGGVDLRETGDSSKGLRLKDGECLTAHHGAFDRDPQDVRHALMRIRHLTGEHLVVPRDVQLRAAHAIVDSDSPEAALRALRVSGVLHVLDRAGGNTTRLTGAIPEIWHRFHPD
jgi:hypothetical protein